MDCHKDHWWTEIVLLFYRVGNCGKTRAEEWQKHVNIYAAIKHPASHDKILKAGTPEHFQETRIKFLIEHLDILDRKLGMLLQFLALLATAVSLVLGRLVDTSKWGHSWSQVLVGAIAAFWFVAIFLCLFGVRRLEWGDLGEDMRKGADISQSDVQTAESVFVGKLISEVIRRTAKFRVAVYTTTLNVFLFFLLCASIAFPFSRRAEGGGAKTEELPSTYVVNASCSCGGTTIAKPNDQRKPPRKLNALPKQKGQ